MTGEVAADRTSRNARTAADLVINCIVAYGLYSAVYQSAYGDYNITWGAEQECSPAVETLGNAKPSYEDGTFWADTGSFGGFGSMRRVLPSDHVPPGHPVRGPQSSRLKPGRRRTTCGSACRPTARVPARPCGRVSTSRFRSSEPPPIASGQAAAVTKHDPQFGFFRGVDLRSVSLPDEAAPGTGHVLALERYDDGLIIRAVIPDPSGLPDRAGDRPRFSEEAHFDVTDDLSTRYRFVGAVSGVAPASHIMSMFTPGPPPSARWVAVASQLGRARFTL